MFINRHDITIGCSWENKTNSIYKEGISKGRIMHIKVQCTTKGLLLELGADSTNA